MSRLKHLIKFFGRTATVKEIEARVNSVEFWEGLIFALKMEVK